MVVRSTLVFTKVKRDLCRIVASARYYSTARPSFEELDKKWIEIWKENPPRYARSEENKDSDKFYVLSMFPYPSGMLHMGHVRVYAISDIMARYRRMNGLKVVHAMGWDAFGLPAENAAIERKIDPSIWTVDNIGKMKEQMNQMLADFDWEREVVSCSPEYYKWTQKLFTLLYNAGYAYRKEASVNWDPVDKTVLANEQVDSEGRSWRSGAIVEKKMLNQWFLGITKFAPELLDDLKLLKDWPSKVKTMQKNWIGKSDGAEITFLSKDKTYTDIKVFTTRPDTLFGVQYIALSLDHPIVKKSSLSDPKLATFLAEAKEMTQDSKVGYKLKDFVLSNPLNPTQFNVPVFVAPYVISDYGSGCVMGCPGHDQRDYEFWTLNAPHEQVKVVVNPETPVDGPIFTGKNGFLNDSCGHFAGLSSAEGGKKIVDQLFADGHGEHTTEWKIRDWLISRQRFWGAPIPMIHCSSCGIVPVPDEDLPVLLPKTNNLGGSGNPLAQIEEFVNTECPSCDGPARRDTDTMDTFMDSSWYFFRYTDPKNQQEIFSYDAASALMPVDIYIGGVEHAILHLLYARFISKFLASQGLWSGGDLAGEPIRRLITQGMVHGKTYNDADTGRFLKPEERDLSDPSNPKSISSGKPAVITYEKMSKSKYNGSDPGECIAKYGADATRAHIIFQAPVADVLSWDESKIVGIERWLTKVLTLGDSLCSEITVNKEKILAPFDKKDLRTEELDLWNAVQTQVTLISNSMEDVYSMNTVISNYMILTNTILAAHKSKKVSSNIILESYKRLIKLMAPVTPSTAEECWEKILASSGEKWTSVYTQSWPRAEEICEPVDIKFNVFVNGKMRFVFVGTKELYSDHSKFVDLVCATEEGKKFILGKTIKKVIVPPGRATISFVLV